MSCLRVDYINHHLILFYYVSSIFLPFHLACPLFYFSSTHHIILTLISPFILILLFLLLQFLHLLFLLPVLLSFILSSFLLFPFLFLLHSCYSFHSCRSLSTLACSQSMTWAMTLAFHPPLEKMTVRNNQLLLCFYCFILCSLFFCFVYYYFSCNYHSYCCFWNVMSYSFPFYPILSYPSFLYLISLNIPSFNLSVQNIYLFIFSTMFSRLLPYSIF